MGNLLFGAASDPMAESTVAGHIADNKVVMFSKSYCPFCVQAKEILKAGGVDFLAVELDQVDGGSALQAALLGISGQRTVPNTYIGQAHLGGCDDLKAAKGSGKLAEMLNAAGAEHSF